MDEFLNSLREYHGTFSVGKEKEGLRDLLRTLRQGGCIGVLGDQYGGSDGVWVRFFGRLTTCPRGPFALALKTGATLLPVFMIRRHGPFHELIFLPEFRWERTGDREKDIQANAQQYIELLESYVRKYPAQWLWGHKRWKKTRTKRIVILSDGKPGHVKQSEAVAKELIESAKDADPPYQFRVEKLEVRFRSPSWKRLFHLFAFFFFPWAQGRLSWLRPFFTRESAEQIESVNPDIIFSAGASLAPLSLCLARENLAKPVILMKPSFPYTLCRYELALIPFHDRGILPRGSFRVQGALSGMDENLLEASGRVLAHSLRDPKKVKIGLFLGGETRNFKPSLSDVESILFEIEHASQRLGGDFVVTTSRRTPEAINRFIRSQLGSHPRCQLCVIASEDSRPEVVPGMMALADCLVVTEDSLSMISEAISSGKPVVVVKMGSDGLPEKHYRFQELVEKELNVPVVETKKLCEVLSTRDLKSAAPHFSRERARIREKLRGLL
jgi:mitochondrial fission protein ELM1